jgi:hypothetical protein
MNISPRYPQISSEIMDMNSFIWDNQHSDHISIHDSGLQDTSSLVTPLDRSAKTNGTIIIPDHRADAESIVRGGKCDQSYKQSQ